MTSSTSIMSPSRINNLGGSSHQSMYKMPSPTIRNDVTWKERYRQHCKQEFRKSREKMVNKLRKLSFDNCSMSNGSDNIDSQQQQDTPISVRQIAEQEWRKLFGYDITSSRHGLRRQNSSQMDCDGADEDDFIDFDANIKLFEDIQRELQEEEQRLLPLLPDEEDENYLRYNFESSASIRCPKCSQITLEQDQQTILCKQCQFKYQLDPAIFNGTVHILSDIYFQHAQQGTCADTVLSSIFVDDQGQAPFIILCVNCDYSCCL
ncbi:unnamed protein product [Didymodactylos carnosus]|uniref:RPA-interacting protein n=1 Tax=Didymodactylos carnosus TaxID=1234261 RepID=A0A814KYB0_9BILA|nr:unnamed protein product [Didymodactylos carnosus]CAF1125176.1 unnamed protein product [Didymodactylos carnosus]CAF3826389.1 unnamed protein product [Didymodactylos carnosus]CAF3902401.1 unnamed protein product [Didymodactylos carnosus]